jgi:hypothetical protein
MSQYDGLDYLRGITFEQQIQDWMGPYYPTIKYCTTDQFQHDACGFPAALQQAASGPAPRTAQSPRRRVRTHARPRRSLHHHKKSSVKRRRR